MSRMHFWTLYSGALQAPEPRRNRFACLASAFLTWLLPYPQGSFSCMLYDASVQYLMVVRSGENSPLYWGLDDMDSSMLLIASVKANLTEFPSGCAFEARSCIMCNMRALLHVMSERVLGSCVFLYWQRSGPISRVKFFFGKCCIHIVEFSLACVTSISHYTFLPSIRAWTLNVRLALA